MTDVQTRYCLVILFIGLAVGWFLMSQESTEKIAQKKVEKIKTKENEAAPRR